MDSHYQSANSAKADFDEIYNQLDPRAYYETLGALDYRIPQIAAPVFCRIIESLREILKRRHIRVLDIGCSYGINAAVIKYGLDWDDLHGHYSHLGRRSPREVLEADRRLIAQRSSIDGVSIVGLDQAECAASYGYFAGFLDSAIPENLEEAPPTGRAAAELSRVDLVISTGAVGYVTGRTFARILACQPDDPPWVASFVLRMFPYDEIARCLDRHGLVTETLAETTFAQRRFRDRAEMEAVLSRLRAAGVDPSGRESTGAYHAHLYLSRPTAVANALALDALVANAADEARVAF